MYTIIIVTLVAVIACFILSTVLYEDIFLNLAVLVALVGVGCCALLTGMPEINGQASKGVEVETPAKYIDQTYYIDNSKRLYIQQEDTTKQFGGDVSSKIEYKDSAKEPSIKFKTIKSVGKPDAWIPFKYKEKFKTSVSKVILPKSDLTGNLTKMTVLK